MKKVIAVLMAVVVLIVGTAVGVAVKASHLQEKTLLTAGDVWLAMASQGQLARPVLGDFAAYAANGAVPVVYQADGVYVMVYEYDDASVRRQSDLSPEKWLGRSRMWAVGVDGWRNLEVVYALPPKTVKHLSAPANADQRSRLLAQRLTVEGKIDSLRTGLKETLNTLQTVQIEAESETMRYIIEQTYYCMPAEGGQAGLLYDCAYQSRLLSCAYKVPPKDESKPTHIQLVLGQKTGEQTIRYNMRYWNGQGVLPVAEYFGEQTFSGQRLTDKPMALRYRVDFRRDAVEEEARAVMQMEP